MDIYKLVTYFTLLFISIDITMGTQYSVEHISNQNYMIYSSLFLFALLIFLIILIKYTNQEKTTLTKLLYTFYIFYIIIHIIMISLLPRDETQIITEENKGKNCVLTSFMTTTSDNYPFIFFKTIHFR